jgi:hypothetical protein
MLSLSLQAFCGDTYHAYPETAGHAVVAAGFNDKSPNRALRTEIFGE